MPIEPILTDAQVEFIAREWLGWSRPNPSGAWHLPNCRADGGCDNLLHPIEQTDPRFLFPLETYLKEQDYFIQYERDSERWAYFAVWWVRPLYTLYTSSHIEAVLRAAEEELPAAKAELPEEMK